MERTESASPAYIKELLRKAAVLAVTGGAGVVLQDEHVERAAEEMSLGGRLGLRIMGFQGAAAAASGGPPQLGSGYPKPVRPERGL